MIPDPVAVLLTPPLSAQDLRRLSEVSRLPLAWTVSPRRRRVLLLTLAAPGFGLVASTPLHRAPALLTLGGVLFAAALLFRRLTEPVFVRAAAAALWPPSRPVQWEAPDA